MSSNPAPKAYPLQWPVGVPRTASRKRATFNSYRKQLSVSAATGRLQEQVDRLPATGVVLSTNVALRLDGQPRGDQREPSDPGACLYFNLKGRPHAMPCDRWDRVADNIAAIAKHIEAIRGMERWGVADVAQMFAGFAALPQPTAVATWWDVLGVAPHTPTLEVEARYRELVKRVHPDVGGSADEMARLNAAMDSFRAERGL